MDLDWKNLGFNIMKTDYNVRCVFRNGQWGELETSSDDTLPIHIGATCLHYGQQSFEGLKAYEGADGKIRLFRHEDNARRMITSARGILLAEPPVSLFMEAVEKVVTLNRRFVPPYGTGASLYIRPLLIGTGPYFHNGFLTPAIGPQGAFYQATAGGIVRVSDARSHGYWSRYLDLMQSTEPLEEWVRRSRDYSLESVRDETSAITDCTQESLLESLRNLMQGRLPTCSLSGG